MRDIDYAFMIYMITMGIRYAGTDYSMSSFNLA
jgi:hypothetical protein